MFKFFLCIFLYFQDLFYNKHEKINMFIFWKVNNLEEIIFDFLGETVEETFLVHTHA